MPSYIIVIPENTVIAELDHSSDVMYFELLHKTGIFTYHSRDVEEERSFTIDLELETFQPRDHIEFPADLDSVIKATFCTVTSGEPRNDYEKEWGTNEYNRVRGMLLLAKRHLESISFKPQFSFDPLATLGLGGMVNEDNNHYEVETIHKLPKKKGSYQVKRKLTLDLNVDKSVQLMLSYSYSGQSRYNEEIQLPNLGKVILKAIADYSVTEEHLIKAFVLRV